MFLYINLKFKKRLHVQSPSHFTQLLCIYLCNKVMIKKTKKKTVETDIKLNNDLKNKFHKIHTRYISQNISVLVDKNDSLNKYNIS